LGILVEQLKSPTVTQIFEILHKGGSQIGEGFSPYRDDLLKYYVQARDNVRFLFTILRHFKVILVFKQSVRKRLGILIQDLNIRH
jgi:dynein heavy chain